MTPFTLAAPPTAPTPVGLLAVTTAELTIRMVVGLVVVGLLLVVLNRIGRRVLDGRSAHRPAITVRHQQRLDRHASVTLLTAGDRNLLVGTTSQSIVLLAEGDDLAVPGASLGSPGRGARTAGAGGAGTNGAAGGQPASPTIDVRARRGRNPIRVLQNKTVRRS